MFNSPFTLPPINDFVAGDEDILYFDIVNERGVLLDSSALAVQFSVTRYTNQIENPLLTKSCSRVKDFSSRFMVTFNSKDTIDWYGKYIYQVTTKDITGNIKSLQGIMSVVKNIDQSGTISFNEEVWT